MFWLNLLLPRAVGLSPAGMASNSLAWPVLLFALALSALTGMLCGAGPALGASSQLLAQGLVPSGRTTGTKAGVSLRAILVVGQVALSVMLLIGAGLLIRSFANLSGTNPGFEIQHLLTGEVQLQGAQYADDNRRIRFFDALREEIAAVPGVRAAGFISNLPIRDPFYNLAAWETAHPPASPADRQSAYRRVVLPGYFRAARIPLRAGRDIGMGDRENAPPVMVINERMARTFFPNRNPLGQRVSVDVFGRQPAFEVVGVAGDVCQDSVGDGGPMTMYLSYYQYPDWTLRFAVRTDREPESISRTVRRLVLERDRTIAVENLISMERIVGESLAPEQTTAVLLGLLAAIALLLAAIGLYGVLAYSVTQRTREIGVRMALGAKAGSVLRLVMGQGVVMASIGIAIGLAGAGGLTHLLSSLLFGVPATDPMTFCAVPLGLLGVALVATYLPARRAANVDPMRALRQD
jgi:putative ABC transport system permease protein